MAGPIPPFYCVYLLRSSVRHASLYVGSTPNPKRRLKEHNGLVAGGAKRTKSAALRPWEMVIVVSGFTSKIAALQFEWAWQNTHVSRHIPREDRITPMGTAYKAKDRAGRVTTKYRRPILSLRDRLLNLHLLLRVQSFRRWPLRVRFFAEDTFRHWNKWDAASVHKLRPDLCITLETAAAAAEPGTVGSESAIGAIDVGYTPLKPYLEKSLAITKLLEAKPQPCTVCRESITPDSSLFAVCPSENCDMACHLDCLSRHLLLMQQSSDSLADTLLPTRGSCPGCGSALEWSDAMRDLTLRARGQDHISPILTKIKGKKTRDAGNENIVAQVVDGLNDDLITADLHQDDGTTTAKSLAPKKSKAVPRKKRIQTATAEGEEEKTLQPKRPDALKASPRLQKQQKKRPVIFINDSEAESGDDILPFD